MAQKFNWGAALTTLGRGLGDYAEQQRRERTAALLREQALADENRRREQEMADRAELFRRQDLLAEQQYGRVMPPSFTLPGGDVTTGGFGGMRFKPATELALDMYPRQKAAPLPDPTTTLRIVPLGGVATDMTVKTSGLADDVRSYGSQGYASGGYDDQGRLVLRQAAPTPPPPKERTPSQDRLAAAELQARIDAAVRGDIGEPTTLSREMVTYDDKGKPTGSYFVDIPSRGGGQFITHEDFNYFENPEAAGNTYAGSLADTLANRGIVYWDQLPDGVVPISARRNAWENVLRSQPTVAGVAETLPMIADIPSGWVFDDRGTPLDPKDDQFKREVRFGRDDTMPVPEFIKTMVTPKADAESKIAFKAFDKMFKDQYGVSYSSLISKTDVDKDIDDVFRNTGSAR